MNATSSDHALGRARIGDDATVILRDGSGAAAVATVAGASFADLPELLAAADGDPGTIEPGEAVAVATEDLLPPVGRPSKVICVGINYRSHADEGNNQPPDHPILFPKWDTSLTAPYADIPLPPESGKVDWEGELAFVVGRRARRVATADAASVVFGYTVANDVSMRDFQRHTSQWTAGKAWDRSTPIGPVVVPAAGPDPARPDLELRTTVNDEVVQRTRTSEMLFGVPELVAYLTTVMTLVPGDLVLTGTCGGVGLSFDPPRFLQDGDTVEVSVESIGAVRNAFRAAAA